MAAPSKHVTATPAGSVPDLLDRLAKGTDGLLAKQVVARQCADRGSSVEWSKQLQYSSTASPLTPGCGSFVLTAYGRCNGDSFCRQVWRINSMLTDTSPVYASTWPGKRPVNSLPTQASIASCIFTPMGLPPAAVPRCFAVAVVMPDDRHRLPMSLGEAGSVPRLLSLRRLQTVRPSPGAAPGFRLR